jgi:ankyrin repeat protein
LKKTGLIRGNLYSGYEPCAVSISPHPPVVIGNNWIGKFYEPVTQVALRKFIFKEFQVPYLNIGLTTALLRRLLLEKCVTKQASRHYVICLISQLAERLIHQENAQGQSTESFSISSMEERVCDAIMNSRDKPYVLRRLADLSCFKCLTDDELNQSVLGYAVAIGDTQLAGRVLSISNIDINEKDYLFGKPLETAVVKGYKGMVRLLLKAGADPNARDGQEQYSLIYLASKMDHSDILEQLLEAGGVLENSLKWRGVAPRELRVAVENRASLGTIKALFQRDNSIEPLMATVAAKNGVPKDVMCFFIEECMKRYSRENVLNGLLHTAARGYNPGCVGTLETIIEYGIDPKSCNSVGRSAAHEAAECDHQDVLELLEKHGVDLDGVDNLGFSPLQAAATSWKDAHHAVAFLLSKDVVIDRLDRKGKSPLHCAAEKGHTQTLRILLANGADKENLCELNQTPILTAAMSSSTGRQETIKILLAHGVNTKVKTPTGLGLLHLECLHGDRSTVAALLSSGKVDPNEVTNDGKTALMIATQQLKPDIVKILFENGADMQVKTADGKSAIHAAAASGHPEFVQWLIENGAQVNETCGDGLTPLHYAMNNSSSRVVQLLLKAGADIDAKTNQGISVIMRAMQLQREADTAYLLSCGVNLSGALIHAMRHANKNRRVFISLLLDAGVDIHEVDSRGRSALHYAVKGWESLWATEMLLKNGANVDVRDEDGRTPLHMAVAPPTPNTSTIRQLLQHGADTANLDEPSQRLIDTLQTPDTRGLDVAFLQKFSGMQIGKT